MKKPRNRIQTGNPARKRRGEGAPDDGRKRWLGREVNAFFGLPEWLGMLILILAAGAALTVWRWLSG